MKSLRDKTLVVACGVGRDSVGMLVGMHERGLRPAAILFADVGSEKAGTYAFIPELRRWLASVNFPDLTIVRYEPLRAPYTTIEGNMVANATLPGATFGRGSCTMKWKIEPQAKWGRRSPICLDTWARGEKVFKLIGFEACEGYRQKRAADNCHAGKGSPDAARYEWEYPLMDWGWSLAECIAAIDRAGMPIPPKSACWFCPNQQPNEVESLSDEERARIIRMELTAEPFNRKVAGLWRRPRAKRALPGSITEYILDRGLGFVPLAELERIALNPACAKSGRGHTFRPPHNAVSLRDRLAAAGHTVPEWEDSLHLEIATAL